MKLLFDKNYLRSTIPNDTEDEPMAGNIEEPRFFLDHGAIHDRKTGQHVGMEAEPNCQERLFKLLTDMDSELRILLAEQKAWREKEHKDVGELRSWIELLRLLRRKGESLVHEQQDELINYLETLGNLQRMREALLFICDLSGLDDTLIKGADKFVLFRMAEIHQESDAALSISSSMKVNSNEK